MAQLVAAVSATVKRWKVDEIPDARYVKAGDEIVEVLTRYPSRGVIRVLRGAEDSTAASHDAGTELESPTMGAAGGAEQTIRLLGPFHVAHDTPGIDGDLAEVGAGLIPAGAVVIAAWPIITEGLAGAGDTVDFQMQVCVGPAGQVGAPLNATVYVCQGTPLLSPLSVGDDLFPPRHFTGGSQSSYRPAIIGEASSLFVQMMDGGGVEPLSAGEADVYALIAESA